MPDGVNVDFGLLKQPDYTGEYANAFQMGRTLAQQQGQAAAGRIPAGRAVNAMTGAIANPQALPPALTPAPAPETGPATAPKTAQAPAQAPSPAGLAASPELEGRIAALDPPARLQAAQQAELLAGLAAGLRGQPYAERGRMLIHLAPALAARGIPSSALSGFDPTDAALDAAAAQALALHGKLTAGS